jgi:hypothetical protein
MTHGRFGAVRVLHQPANGHAFLSPPGLRAVVESGVGTNEAQTMMVDSDSGWSNCYGALLLLIYPPTS